MVDEAQFSQALEQIYAATMSEAFWPDALKTVGNLFESDFTHFEVLEKRTGRPVFFRNNGATEDALELYVNHYAAVSPRAAFGEAQPEGHVSFDHDMLSEAEIDADEFYNDFMIPQGYKYFLSANLINNDDLFSVFSIQRPLGQDHASPSEIALMQRLTPHLSQAMKIHMRLALQAAEQQGQDLLVGHSTTGVVFLDASGRVVMCNPAGETIISNPANGIDVRNGQITFSSADNARDAHALIARALATGNGTGFAPAGAITLPRATALPLTLIAVPLPGTTDRVMELAAMALRPAVALLICDPNHAPGLPDHLLRTLFGFTPAECRVAQALASGQSPGEYADTAEIGIRTVRTHISRLLAKTGARNRIELMRILGGVPFDFEAGA
jgi:DNA-binding CsgD family transcriptional regulator/PAS domain-containing protein